MRCDSSDPDRAHRWTPPLVVAARTPTSALSTAPFGSLGLLLRHFLLIGTKELVFFEFWPKLRSNKMGNPPQQHSAILRFPSYAGACTLLALAASIN